MQFSCQCSDVRVRRAALRAGLVALAALAACQDSRVKAVDTGISRDSALKVLTQDAKPAIEAKPGTMGAPVDQNPANIYRRDQFLINGVSTEVLYFDSKNRHLGQIDRDTVPWKDLSPVVLVNNKVQGKGWDYLDSIYKANKIPLHQR